MSFAIVVGCIAWRSLYVRPYQPSNAVLDLAWSPDGEFVAASGINHVAVWPRNGRRRNGASGKAAILSVWLLMSKASLPCHCQGMLFISRPIEGRLFHTPVSLVLRFFPTIRSRVSVSVYHPMGAFCWFNRASSALLFGTSH